MALTYDTKNTTYLTNRLEVAQLATENTGLLTLGPKMLQVPEPFIPRYRTTGNGMVYWEGSATVQFELNESDVALLLPPAATRIVPSALILSIGALDNNLNSAVFSFGLEGSRITVQENAGVPVGTVLVLTGVNYFTG